MTQPRDISPVDARTGNAPLGEEVTTAQAFLGQVFASLRPTVPGGGDPRAGFDSLTARMDSDPDFAEQVSMSVVRLLQHADLVPMLTESGMAPSASLGRELFARFRHKILPPLRSEGDLRQLLGGLLPRPDDHRWVSGAGREAWAAFFARIRMGTGVTRRSVARQVLQALGILSVRLAHIGCEPAFTRSLPSGSNFSRNPFLSQQSGLSEFLEVLRSGPGADAGPAADTLRQAMADCAGAVSHVRGLIPEKGAGLEQTYLLLQAEEILGRMGLLLDTVDGNGRVDPLLMADHFIRVVRNEKTRDSIRALLSQAFGQLAYQIAEHKGRRGDGYITTTRREYLAMLGSAMKGGMIISFVALGKNLLSRLPLAPFWQGFAYSMNYSIGFVAIDRTGSTLATKQPAYTANAVAGSIDIRKSHASDPSETLVENLVRVSRSQFASFAGNLLIVFPGTWLLAAAWDRLAGTPIASGDKAQALLADQHPFESMALAYACNTGVCLFLSGLIAGYVQNRMRYGRIPERIERHPALAGRFGRHTLRRLSQFMDEHAGALAGSVALGFMLGMAGMLGRFFGIPFDIRHITISAGNLSIGLYGLGWEAVPITYLIAVLLGVLAIGFLNFLVSFSLAFYVALRSRGLHLEDLPRLLRRMGREFLRRPLDFVRPPADP
jgi:site-specific recombinase